VVLHVQRKRLTAGTTAIALFCVAALLSEASADASPATTIPGDGVYVVGVDVQPGTYVSSNSGYCSWYRLSGLSGDAHDIIASDNTASGKMYATISPSDKAFKTYSCATWQLVSQSPAAASAPAAASYPSPSAPSSTTGPNFRTQSGRVLCAVTPDPTLSSLGPDGVVCEGQFTQQGAQFNAVTTGDGSFYWQDANLAAFDPTVQMAYGQTYHRGNWTIYHDGSGTRFTNNKTGHGMFVSIDNVYAF
jgi:hypothetical protein